MIDSLIKGLLLLSIGAVVLAANVMLVRAALNLFSPGTVLINEFAVISADDRHKELGKVLPRLLQAHLLRTEREAIVSQSALLPALLSAPADQPYEHGGSVRGPLVSISSEIFKPLAVELKVGSVEISGLVGRLQRAITRPQTLDFSVSIEKSDDGTSKAVVAGDLAPLGITTNRAAWIVVHDTRPDTIARRVAYALYHAKLTDYHGGEFGALDLDAFEKLLKAMGGIAQINRKAESGLFVSKDEFAAQLSILEEILDEARSWTQLKEFTAGVADKSGKEDRAVALLREVIKAKDTPDQRRTILRQRIAALQREIKVAAVVPVGRRQDVAPAGKPVRVRKDIVTLHEEQLKALRAGFQALYNKDPNDPASYTFIASIQASPDRFRQYHGSGLFLPWMRAYLLFFEDAIRDVSADLKLPYWNWARRTDDVFSLPPVFAVESIDGVSNPLQAASISGVSDPTGRAINRSTIRDVGKVGAWPPTPSELEALLSVDDYERFRVSLEDVNGRIHGAIGGDMNRITSAFDPIFWVHAANVDRIWAIWQVMHPGAMWIAADLLDAPLEPFGMTVRDVLDTDALGYTYE